MSQESYSASAYSFSIATADALAILRLGRKNFRVQVTDFSWAGFTVSAPRKLARRFKSGCSGKLYHSGADHNISIASTSEAENGDILVSLSRQQENSPQRRSSYGIAKSHSRDVNQSDPLLMVAAGVCLVLLLLATPGWGDEWGTSRYFSDGIQGFGQAIQETFGYCRG